MPRDGGEFRTSAVRRMGRPQPAAATTSVCQPATLGESGSCSGLKHQTIKCSGQSLGLHGRRRVSDATSEWNLRKAPAHGDSLNRSCSELARARKKRGLCRSSVFGPERGRLENLLTQASLVWRPYGASRHLTLVFSGRRLTPQRTRDACVHPGSQRTLSRPQYLQIAHQGRRTKPDDWDPTGDYTVSLPGILPFRRGSYMQSECQCCFRHRNLDSWTGILRIGLGYPGFGTSHCGTVEFSPLATDSRSRRWEHPRRTDHLQSVGTGHGHEKPKRRFQAVGTLQPSSLIEAIRRAD